MGVMEGGEGLKFAGYKFDDKFIVIKRKDAVKYLNETQQEQLWYLLQVIGNSRKANGKSNFNDYLVVNIDEEYAPKIADIIAEHHDIKQIE